MEFTLTMNGVFIPLKFTPIDQHAVPVEHPPVTRLNNTFNYTLPEREPNESFETFWARVKANGECTFCGEQGHQAKACPTLKNNECFLCGFHGHTPKKCNKAIRSPDGTKVGKCTFCKGPDKWGHWLVTCPKREAKFGPFQFPEGTNIERALAP